MAEKTSVELFGQVATVIECGEYTYQETIATLAQLSNYYEENAQLFLKNVPIAQIAQHRQREYEKATATLGKSVTVEGQS